MSGVRATDRRRLPFFMVGKPDLSRLAESCESRSLPYARSLYFALLELANDQRCDEVAASRAELAVRAGVSPETVKRLAPVLVDAGLVVIREVPGYPNEWTLLGGEVGSDRPGGVGSEGPGGRVHKTRGSGLSDPALKETGQEGKNGRSKNPSDSRQSGVAADEVWAHYQATRPNGERCKLGPQERRLIANALAVRPLEDCKLAITGLMRSSYHVDGGYLHLKYALKGGGRDPVVEATIDRLAAIARGRANGNGNGGRLKNATYAGGRTWDELTPAEQETAKANAAMDVWPEDLQARREAPVAMVASSNGHGALTAETFAADE